MLRFLQSVKHEDWRLIGAVGQPAFQNGWANYGATHPAAAFYKDPSGIVRMQGLILGGTAGAVAFTLPVGYRPITGGTLGGTTGHNHLAIATGNGPLGARIDGDTGNFLTPNSTSWVDLSQVVFRAG